MQRPDFLDLFLPADAGIAAALLSLLFALRVGRAKSMLFASAIVAAAAAPVAAGYVPALRLPVDPSRADVVLLVTSFVPTAATAIPGVVDGWRSARIAFAAVAQLVLVLLLRAIPGFVPALTAAELTVVAAVLVVDARAAHPPAPAEAPLFPRFARDDLVVFALSFAAAALVADRVLYRSPLSGDEWADTWQADVFAHLQAYAPARPCEAVFKNWWVFEKDGRMFAQYTPGWPLVMAPFQRAGAVWLAGPAVFAGAAVAVARLARRITAQGLAFVETRARSVRTAGAVAAAAMVLSASALLNGGSRYPHTLVCACFGWMIEGLFALSTARTTRARMGWGAVLGLTSALALAVRPLDGAGLGIGVFALFVWLLRRGRLPRTGLASATLSFAALAALTLVILRLQLGEWLTTGYSLSPLPAKLSIPKAADLAYAFRLDKGTGYWFPCAAPFLAAGLLSARGEETGKPVAWALALAAAGHTALYALVEMGREGTDSGYGPRFHLPLLVPMAVGTGIVATILVERSRVAAWITCATSVAALFVVASVVFPFWSGALYAMSALDRALAAAHLHHAVVVVHEGDLAVQAWDLTRDLPSDRDPDVMIITDKGAGDDFACAEARWKDRRWFVARQRSSEGGWGAVELVETAP